jgi:hypothetical protein
LPWLLSRESSKTGNIFPDRELEGKKFGKRNFGVQRIVKIKKEEYKPMNLENIPTYLKQHDIWCN